jgi:hypothetical protein
MSKGIKIRLVVLTPILAVVMMMWLVNKPPTSNCGSEEPADPNVYKIRATKVVVQPWLGEHQVYGIFTVPDRYKHNKNYAVTMAVRGFDHQFAVVERSDKRLEDLNERLQYVDHVFAPPGHYLLRSYVPTRVALWFLVNGRFGDLRRPCDWTLVFVERSS